MQVSHHWNDVYIALLNMWVDSIGSSRSPLFYNTVRVSGLCVLIRYNNQSCYNVFTSICSIDSFCNDSCRIAYIRRVRVHSVWFQILVTYFSKYKNNQKPVICRYRLPTYSAWSDTMMTWKKIFRFKNSRTQPTVLMTGIQVATK